MHASSPSAWEADSILHPSPWLCTPSFINSLYCGNEKPSPPPRHFISPLNFERSSHQYCLWYIFALNSQVSLFGQFMTQSMSHYLWASANMVFVWICAYGIRDPPIFYNNVMSIACGLASLSPWINLAKNLDPKPSKNIKLYKCDLKKIKTLLVSRSEIVDQGRYFKCA